MPQFFDLTLIWPTWQYSVYYNSFDLEPELRFERPGEKTCYFFRAVFWQESAIKSRSDAHLTRIQYTVFSRSFDLDRPLGFERPGEKSGDFLAQNVTLSHWCRRYLLEGPQVLFDFKHGRFRRIWKSAAWPLDRCNNSLFNYYIQAELSMGYIYIYIHCVIIFT